MTDWKRTLAFWSWSAVKIPILFFVRPVVLRLDEEVCEVKIPLNFWTRNHLKSMYFGVLAMGADMAGGAAAMEQIQKSGKKVDLIFSEFHAKFLKRPDSDVHFVCREGKRISRQVAETIRTGERISEPLKILAFCPKTFGDEVVGEFEITLSLKVRK